jgi:translation elongation factor P/translation initiation factor 5A
MNKKFIKTTDEKTASQLMASGFQLVAHAGSIYTFMNKVPEHFSFDAIDKKMIVYDNILSL